MARRLSGNLRTVPDLIGAVDIELQRLDMMTKAGFVGNKRLASPGESYLFTENGTLKFYDAETDTIKTVTIT